MLLILVDASQALLISFKVKAIFCGGPGLHLGIRHLWRPCRAGKSVSSGQHTTSQPYAAKGKVASPPRGSITTRKTWHTSAGHVGQDGGGQNKSKPLEFSDGTARKQVLVVLVRLVRAKWMALVHQSNWRRSDTKILTRQDQGSWILVLPPRSHPTETVRR